MVLAVSTAHPPPHSAERARALLDLERQVPILHLWMAGDQAAHALETLKRAGAPVTEEPRAAIRALAGLARLANLPVPGAVQPIDGAFEEWGLPLVEGEIARTADEAVAVAEGPGLSGCGQDRVAGWPTRPRWEGSEWISAIHPQ